VVHNKETEQEIGYGSGSPDHEAVDTKEDQTRVADMQNRRLCCSNKMLHIVQV